MFYEQFNAFLSFLCGKFEYALRVAGASFESIGMVYIMILMELGEALDTLFISMTVRMMNIAR
jgi:hypothetical protein